MKKVNHPTDDFLREALKGHRMTPSDEAKKAFLRDVLQEANPGKKGKKGLLLFSALIVVLIGAGIFLGNLPSEKSGSVPRQPASQEASQDPAANSRIQALHNPGSNSSSQKSPSSDIPVHENTSKANRQPALENAQQPSMNHKGEHIRNSGNQKVQNTVPPEARHDRRQPGTGMDAEPSVPMAALETQESATGVSTALAVMEPLTGDGHGHVFPADTNDQNEDDRMHAEISQDASVATRPVTTMNPPDTLIKTPDSLAAITEGKQERIKDGSLTTRKWSPSVGLYYSPEWMFNTLEGTKFVSNFGIEGSFHFGRFSIRTGAGLSVAKGTNELVVEYNDFLGAYNKLDSIDFTWNEPAHNYIPTLYVSRKDVWDSLMKLDYAKVVKQYTYLQVPLVMGYDFLQTDRISVGARIGPLMSVLLSSKQLSAPYDPGEKRIISMNDIAPEQVSLNWQVLAGASVAIRLLNALYFEAEPSVRYYFNSVYEKPANNAKPWSIGIRGAFIVKF